MGRSVKKGPFVQEALVKHLDELRKVKPDKLVRRRREKFLGMGRFSED